MPTSSDTAVGRPIISARGLSKRYKLGAISSHATLRTVAANWSRVVRRQRSSGEIETRHIWALRDLDFDIQPGEVVGIIGRNGAGKSTLLRILSNITTPTEGSVEIGGRVGSLLEVGTGFHPELTGRENVYLTGAILGIDRADIRRRFDEIIAFSGLEGFLSTPIKHYSSGMQLRLAFSVSAHLRPDVLILDEILAVGDAEFQAKCLAKLQDHMHDGRTVLFTSHDLGSVRDLCRRTLWLDRGRLMADGPTEQVISEYLGTTHTAVEAPGDRSHILTADVDHGWGGATDVSAYDVRGDERDSVRMGDRWWVHFNFEMSKHVDDVVAGLTLVSALTQRVTTLRTHACDPDAGHYTVTFEIKLDFAPGQVQVSPMLSAGAVTFYRAHPVDAVRIEPVPFGASGLRVEEGDLLAQPPTETIWGAAAPP